MPDTSAPRFASGLSMKADDADPRWPLSAEVIDTVSLLVGRVTAVTYYLHGQVDAFVEPRFPEGTMRTGHWIALERLEPFRGAQHLTELGICQ